MTELTALPSPDSPESPPEAPPPPPPRRPKRDVVPWLYGLGFIVLACAIFYLWETVPQTAAPTGPDPALQAIQQQLRGLESRVARLEQRPAAASADLGPVIARIDALEKRPVPDLGPIQARLTALEQKPSGDPQLAGRVDALATRLDTLSRNGQSAEADLARRIEADQTRLAALEQAAGRVSSLADRATRLARVQGAQAALAAGQPLGEIPGAPPALARFATTKPPTEAGLRLAFPAAERAARAASRPDTEGQPFMARVLSRAEELVTVRQGDHVLVGDAAAGILARARTALDAGDLAGAVAAVSSLTGPAAQAMAGWLADAQSLLDARAALADMAAKS